MIKKINTNIQLANKNINLIIFDNKIILDNTIDEIIHLFQSMIDNAKIDKDIFKYNFLNLIYSILNGIDVSHINIYNLLDKIHFDILTNQYTCIYNSNNNLEIEVNTDNMYQGISDVIYSLNTTLDLMYKLYKN